MWASRRIKSPEARLFKSLIRLSKTKHQITALIIPFRAIERRIPLKNDRLCGTVSVSWHQHYRRQCVFIIMVLVMILFIYVSVMWDRISVMTSTLQQTMSVIIMVLVMILFIYVSVMWNRISVMTSTLQKTMCFNHHGSGYDFIHIRVCYVAPYQCHDINITEDNVFSSSWFWLLFYSYTCLLCGTVSESWPQHYRRQCVFIIMVLVMILFIYVSVMWNLISVMTLTLQKTMCFHHHGSGYDFIHIRVCYVEPYQCHDINITEDNVLSSSWFWLWFIHIRVCYVEPYQCHDINITEDNVFSSSWFWLWFHSYTCLLCGTVSVSWHQHYRRQCVFIIMVLVMILFIYVSVMWNRISVMTSTLQKTMCFHHHGSGYDFIHIRVAYAEPYQCHDINITEDNVLSSS